MREVQRLGQEEDLSEVSAARTIRTIEQVADIIDRATDKIHLEILSRGATNNKQWVEEEIIAEITSLYMTETEVNEILDKQDTTTRVKLAKDRLTLARRSTNKWNLGEEMDRMNETLQTCTQYRAQIAAWNCQ